MKAFYLSAAHKSSGKTTLSIGLCAALRRRGEAVQPFKKGPDYIDPMWLGRAAGRDCVNLDFYTQTDEEIARDFARFSAGADIALIEGNKGLYDGLDLHGSNSNAALAKALRLPVVLVLDTRGTIRGVAPLLLGYRAFDPEIEFAGVILNRVGGSRHETKLRQVIEHYTDLPVLGAVQNDERIALLERHLGLVPSNEAAEVERSINAMAEAVAAQVDLDLLLTRAASPQPPSFPPAAVDQCGKGLRIGYAADAAFGFYYPNDLAQLRARGAELVPIDMLHTAALPPLDGLIIGGGFPETQMQALAANASMRASVRAAIEAGLPTYAECGGLMYLAEAIEWQGERLPMVGIIPAVAAMHAKPVGKGYIRLEETGDGLWPDAPVGEITGHEFHYSALGPLPEGARFAYRVRRGQGIDGAHDGFVYRNLLANYAHLREVDAHRWTERFLRFVRTTLSQR